MPELTLIIGNYNLSSWSLRPWLAMKQLAIPFATERIDLEVPGEKPARVKAAILARSPSGRVPALRIDGLTIWDSLAICELLAETWPDKAMWPVDGTARAVARAVSAEMHSGFGAMRGAMPMNVVASTPLLGVPADVAADIARVQEIWRDCRSRFGGGGPFLMGRFSIADAMFAPVVSRFTTYAIETDQVCRAYMDAIWELAAMQEWRAEAAREVAASEPR